MKHHPPNLSLLSSKQRGLTWLIFEKVKKCSPWEESWFSPTIRELADLVQVHWIWALGSMWAPSPRCRDWEATSCCLRQWKSNKLLFNERQIRQENIAHFPCPESTRSTWRGSRGGNFLADAGTRRRAERVEVSYLAESLRDSWIICQKCF